MFDVFKTPEFKKALRFYIEEVKNNRKHFLISMFSAIIWCFLVILHPYLIKRIVDDGIVASNQQVIIVFLSFLIAIGYIRAASIGVRRYFSMSVSFNVEAEIRNTIFGHMQRLAFKYHDKVPTGELMARASSDASQVRLAFAIAPLATANVFLLLLLSVTLVSIDFILGLIVLLSIPLVLYIAGNFASRAMEVSLKVKEAEAEMTTEVEEQLGGIRVVKAFGNEDEASIKVERSIEKIYETSVNFLHLRTRFVPLFELLDEQPSIINNDDLVEFPTDGNGTIEFENVDFSYGNDTIFNELSFKVEGQKTIAIVGATGSGKSTLSYLLPRLYDVKSGTIKIDNVDIKKIKLDDLRNNVSLAFEESFLFSNSAKDLITKLNCGYTISNN